MSSPRVEKPEIRAEYGKSHQATELGGSPQTAHCRNISKNSEVVSALRPRRVLAWTMFNRDATRFVFD